MHLPSWEEHQYRLTQGVPFTLLSDPQLQVLVEYKHYWVVSRPQGVAVLFSGIQFHSLWSVIAPDACVTLVFYSSAKCLCSSQLAASGPLKHTEVLLCHLHCALFVKTRSLYFLFITTGYSPYPSPWLVSASLSSTLTWGLIVTTRHEFLSELWNRSLF